MDFDYDAHTRWQLHNYLDSLDDEDCTCTVVQDEVQVDDDCPVHGDNEPDPDRFRDEDPADREDY